MNPYISAPQKSTLFFHSSSYITKAFSCTFIVTKERRFVYDLLQSYTLLENSHIMEACCLAAYLPAGSSLHYQIKQSLGLLFHGLILYQYAGIEIDPVGLFACQAGVGRDLHGRNRRCERSSTSCGKQYDMCSCGCQCGSCYQIVARCGQKGSVPESSPYHHTAIHP